jgi:hypothetical protein
MFIKELGKNDVLLGRGTGPNEHEGNVRFRSLAAEILRSCETSSASSGTILNKTMLAKKVLAATEERNGRFVRRLTRDEIASIGGMSINNTKDQEPKNKYLYLVVPYGVALDKAKQSFRHQRRVLAQNPKVSASCEAVSKSWVREQTLLNHRQSRFREALAARPIHDLNTIKSKQEAASAAQSLLQTAFVAMDPDPVDRKKPFLLGTTNGLSAGLSTVISRGLFLSGSTHGLSPAPELSPVPSSGLFGPSVSGNNRMVLVDPQLIMRGILVGPPHLALWTNPGIRPTRNTMILSQAHSEISTNALRMLLQLRFAPY